MVDLGQSRVLSQHCGIVLFLLRSSAQILDCLPNYKVYDKNMHRKLRHLTAMFIFACTNEP